MLESGSSTAVTVIADTPECPRHPMGLPLRPGMVLHLATPTWGPPIAQDLLLFDTNVDVPSSLAARQAQLAAPLRRPVRKLGPHGQLTEEEILVLGVFLSLQRAGNFGTDDPEGKSGAYLPAKCQQMLSSPKARAALWDALVDAASRRVAPASEISHVNRALALVVNPKVFCDNALTPPGPRPDLALAPYELKLLREGLLGFDCTNFKKDTEAFGQSADAVAVIPLRPSPPGAAPSILVSSRMAPLPIPRPRSARSSTQSLCVAVTAPSVGGHSPNGRSPTFVAAAVLFFALGFPAAILDYGVNGVVGRCGSSFAPFAASEDLSAAGAVRRLKPIRSDWHLASALAADDLARVTPGNINYLVWSEAWTGHSPDPWQP